jgi:hypothetical protein
LENLKPITLNLNHPALATPERMHCARTRRTVSKRVRIGTVTR